MSNHDPLVNVEAEAALLGAMMLDNDVIAEWADRVRVADFHEPLHQKIYRTMLSFRAKGAAATPMTMRPIFAIDEASGHGDYLLRLVEEPAIVVSAAQCADITMKMSIRRQARDAGEAFLAAVNEDIHVEVDELASTLARETWSASERVSAAPPRSAGDAIRSVRERQRRIALGEVSIGAMCLTIPVLDTVIGPLTALYYIIAGRPGHGKSTIASSMAIGYAAGGDPMLYIHGEMDEEQMNIRAAADISHAMGHPIPHDDIRRGALDEGALHRIERVETRADQLPLEYVEMRDPTIDKIEAEVARQSAYWAARGKKLRGVVIDYIGLVGAVDQDGRAIENTIARTNAVSRGLMRIRKKYDVAIIALAQLNRGLEQRSNKRPVASDLRDSGQLEQDADVILLVHREEVFLEDAEPQKGVVDKGVNLWDEWEIEWQRARGKVDLINAKNRHNKRITRQAAFLGKFYAVRDLRDLIDPDDEESSPMLFN